ncbi:MAG: hypothetical protein ACOZAO_04270 [Patescibacteria group bacterium]
MSDKKLLLVTLLILSFGYFFITSALKQGATIDVVEEQTELVEEVKPVVAFLEVDNGKSVKSYRVRLETKDSIEDLFEYLNKEEGFSFETTHYTYGTELQSINGEVPAEGYVWSLYIENKKEQANISQLNLIPQEGTDELNVKVVLEKDTEE